MKRRKRKTKKEYAKTATVRAVCGVCGNERFLQPYSVPTDNCQRCNMLINAWGKDGARWVLDNIHTDFTDYFELKRTVLQWRNDFRDARKTFRTLGRTKPFPRKPRSGNYAAVTQAWKRDNPDVSCVKCEDSNATPHHRVPVRLGGDPGPKNIMPLCERCHRKTHRILNKLIREWMSNHMTQEMARELSNNALESF